MLFLWKSFLFILCLLILSCAGSNSGNITKDKDLVGVETKEIKFLPSDVLQLKSYYLSSSYHSDSLNILVAYNYKEKALDFLNLKTKRVEQAKLETEGPTAISRLSGIYVHNLDSIWLYDESGRVLLVNKVGKVTSIVDLHKQLNSQEQLVINTNYAMSTIHLGYHAAHKSLLLTVKDASLSPTVFRVKEISLESGTKGAYDLSPSVIEPDISTGYANMNAPNVNFVNDQIIYNYPIESRVYTIDMTTGKRNVFEADSRYTQNRTEKCQSKDYALWERHGIENPHFYDVMYIPQCRMYARLHLDKAEFDTNKGMDQLINGKNLYLMLFNEDMEKQCEVKLAEHRYNYFTGWSTFGNGIMLFVDNVLDNGNDSDDLIVDLVSPKDRNI